MDKGMGSSRKLAVIALEKSLTEKNIGKKNWSNKGNNM